MTARPRLAHALACMLAASAWAQDPPAGRSGQANGQTSGQGQGGGGGFDYRRTILGAADADGDGAVTSAEWATFTSGLEQGGAIDKTRLKARVVASSLDRDGDRKATSGELAEALKALDTDANGALEASELGTRGRRGLALGIAAQAGDLDADGALSASERDALLAAAGADPAAAIGEALWVEWVASVQARPSADRTAMTPSVLLLSIDGALDQDFDGKVEPDDLQQLFAALDADASGSIESGELRPQRASGQGGQGQGAPLESVRPLDDEQRAKPPLVKWQRSLDDALELQKKTGQPLLICVNMDGEPASETLAWYRYRDPEFAKLTEGFVPLIVSPDRHTPIDHDDRGRRRPDPRFGRVLESEHAEIEPVLYERYFNGTRVAPRHVGIAPDGSTLFDIYLTNDLTQIDRALAQHGVAAPPAPSVEEDTPRDLTEVLQSPDASDREAVEGFLIEGTWRDAFEAASRSIDSKRTVQHPELLRLALRHEDARVVRQALWTAVREFGRVPSDLVGEVFRASAAHPELRGVLIGACGREQRLAKTPEAQARARRWFLAFEGLAQPSQIVDLERWRAAFAEQQSYAPPAVGTDQLDALLEELDSLQGELSAAPRDAALRLRVAELSLHVARILLASGQDPSIALEEAYANAQAAETAGESSGRAAGVQAWVAYQQSEMAAAVGHGARALPALAREGDPALAFDVLHAFAQARAREIYDAMTAGEGFEPAWVADVRDAYEALLAHPGATEKQAVELLGFLGALDARAEQSDVARRAVQRFPLSADLHSWLRTVVLRDVGADGLELAYGIDQSRLNRTAPGATAQSTKIDIEWIPESAQAGYIWFYGLAALVAAERQVGNGNPEAALSAYGRCVMVMLASQESEPAYADSALHYVCLARSGEARLLAEAKRWDEASRAISEGLRRRVTSASIADGLGNTPTQNAHFVLARMQGAGLPDQAKALRDELTAAGVDLTVRRTEE
jgi:hypothetical protein